MTRVAHGLVLILLLFSGVTGCAVGWLLISVPSADLLGISGALLWRVPFRSLLVPGVVLFALVGLGSMLAASRVIRRRPLYPYYVMVQGVVIYLCVVAEMVLVRSAHPLQLVYAVIAVALFELGAWLARRHRVGAVEDEE